MGTSGFRSDCHAGSGKRNYVTCNETGKPHAESSISFVLNACERTGRSMFLMFYGEEPRQLGLQTKNIFWLECLRRIFFHIIEKPRLHISLQVLFSSGEATQLSRNVSSWKNIEYFSDFTDDHECNDSI